MCGLRSQELANGKWEIFLERIFVSGFGIIFAFLSRYQERMVTAAERCF